jgi:hypothetical protein
MGIPTMECVVASIVGEPHISLTVAHVRWQYLQKAFQRDEFASFPVYVVGDRSGSSHAHCKVDLVVWEVAKQDNKHYLLSSGCVGHELGSSGMDCNHYDPSSKVIWTWLVDHQRMSIDMREE